MPEGNSGGHAESRFAESSRGSTWQERRQKRHEDREHEREEEQSGLREGSYQTLQTVSSAIGHNQYDERDQEIERLRRLVRDFEPEERNRHQQWNQDKREIRDDNMGDRDDGESRQSDSH